MSEMKCPFCGELMTLITAHIWNFAMCTNGECAARCEAISDTFWQAIHDLKAEKERLREVVEDAYFEAWFDRQRSDGGTREREAAWNDSKARQALEVK